jgi:hypothetical protein
MINDRIDDASPPVAVVGTAKKCFTSIQSRRVWSPVVTNSCSLCPSMDLMVFGLQQATTVNKNKTDGDDSPAVQPAVEPAVSAVQPATSTLWLHRTVTWQKLSTLAPAASDEPESALVASSISTDTDANIVEDETDKALVAATWRPDGRLLATASKSRVTLYNVEDMLGVSSMSSSSMSGGDSEPGKITTLLVTGTVVGLYWAHVGKPHPDWKLSSAEVQEDVSVQYRSMYVDRTQTFLPPSSYHQSALVSGLGGGHGHEDHAPTSDMAPSCSHTILPTCQTPLSLLCAATVDNGIHLFLHGRYPILHLKDLSSSSSSTATQNTVATTHRTPNVQMVASTDLSHLTVHCQGTAKRDSVISLVSVPALARHAHHLQSVSALFSSTSQHLHHMEQSVTEIRASWKSSVKPLDLKMEGLVKLLQNYGLETTKSTATASGAGAGGNNVPLRAHLTQYILSGHTRAAPDLSNAADQFFTGLNDQLMQRLERSLQVAVASVETKLRKGLVSPAQALVVQAGDLHGLARYASFLLKPAAAQRFQECAEILLISIETAVTELIEARFRLRDFLGWLRSTAAQIKARGTAANSVQRENAQKRRVPEAVVQRMLRYLQTDNNSSETTGASTSSNGSVSLTETLLGLNFSSLLEDTPNVVRSRPCSPKSVHGNIPSSGMTKATPTVPHVAQKTAEAAQVLFQQPRLHLSQSIRRTDLLLESSASKSPIAEATQHRPVAMMTRIGSAGVDAEDVPFGEARPGGFFVPIIEKESTETTSPFNHRQWSVIAKTTQNPATGCDCVQLHAIPLSWTSQSLSDDLACDDVDEDDDDDSDAPSGIAGSFFLSTLLQLPPNHFVVDMSFYGNDGKSSLSSGMDSGTGKEERQSLGLLVARELGPTAISLQVWLVPYDTTTFFPVEIVKDPNGAISLDVPLNAYQHESRSVHVRAMPESSDDDDEQDEDSPAAPAGTLFAKTRQVSTLESLTVARFATLTLSGSRGIGAIVTPQLLGVSDTLELLDLEEDEEEEEEEIEESEGNEAMDVDK